MHYNKPPIVWIARPLLLVYLMLAIAGCAASQTGADATETDKQIGLAAAPEGMDGDHLTVTLLDSVGRPVTDAVVRLEGNMNHAGMVPVVSEEIADDADGSADGRYTIPFQFTMMGDWIVTVMVQWADGTTTTHDIDVTANDAGVRISDVGSIITSGNLILLNAMARPVPVAGGNGAIYLTIINRGDTEERLQSASSPLAPAELHESSEENGIMRMRMMPEGFVIRPGEQLSLQPGGKHIMLVGIENPVQAGQTIAVTLEFANTPAITLTVPVHAFDNMEAQMAGDMDHTSHP